MCRKAKDHYYNDKCAELEDLDRKYNPKLYTKMKQLTSVRSNTHQGIKDKNGKIIAEDDKIVKRWSEYIKELYDGHPRHSDRHRNPANWK